MLHWLDWTIIIAFLSLSLGIGLYFRKGAGKSVSDFFLGGRNLPWYIAGLSMVATTFAADTPLAVSELVAQGGIAKNWLWWSFILGGSLTTFFFAMLWRRSGVLTELEFITLRYEGKPAFYLRLFKSIYLGLFLNAIIIAWVNLAMMTLIEVFFDVDRSSAMLLTFGMMVLAVIYSALSGLKGVAMTDTIQFIIAMIGCIILAILVVNDDHVGGVMAMKEKLPSGALDFVPSFSSSGSELAHGFGLSVGAFLSFVAIQWWSSWYPGAEPGGGGYVAQRMMSTRSEKESVWATLLFQIGHYCVRPWPWIIVGLCAMVLYAPEITNPELYETLSSSSYTTSGDFISNHNIDSNADIKSVRYFFEPRLGFVFAMRDFLPTGLVGLLLTAFIAAYLSTISTQVNWGASYLVNDFWIPVSKSENQKALVRTSRITSILVMIAGALITPMVTSISAVWAFIMQCGAGLGLVLILRWYWWRVNAWAEITATLAPLLGYTLSLLVLEPTYGLDYTDMNGPLYFTVVFTTISWIAVMFLTKAPSAESIKMFEQRVRPMGLWPKSIIQTSERNKSMKWMFGGWISMTCTIVFTLFTIGKLILLESTEALIFLAFTAMSVIALRFFLKKTNIFDRNSEME